MWLNNVGAIHFICSSPFIAHVANSEIGVCEELLRVCRGNREIFVNVALSLMFIIAEIFQVEEKLE